jgi:DNA modification methylase
MSGIQDCVQIDDATLYLGDCVEVMASLPPASIDLCLTSPPYDTLRTYGGHAWDFPQTAQAITTLLRPGAALVWIVGDTTRDGQETCSSFRQALYFVDVCRLNLHDTMIYRKTNPGGARGSNRAYWQCFEYMFVFSKGPLCTFRPLCDRKNVVQQILYTAGGGRKTDGSVLPSRSMAIGSYGRRMNIWDVSSAAHDSTHPGAFPLSLARDHILSWSNPGEIVLDCMMGGGTTGVAAYETGRRFIGIDIEPDYWSMACRKIHDVHREGRLFVVPTPGPVEATMRLFN